MQSAKRKEFIMRTERKRGLLELGVWWLGQEAEKGNRVVCILCHRLQTWLSHMDVLELEAPGVIDYRLG